jgi:redox-sensitive bicupin YhaK (pirin superfamily)
MAGASGSERRCRTLLHHGNVVPMSNHDDDDDGEERANLVVGEFGRCKSSIPLDPAMGQVFFVDLLMQNENETFDKSIGNEGPVEVGIYVVSGRSVAIGGHDADGKSFSIGSLVVLQRTEANSHVAVRSTSPNTRIAIVGGTPLPEKRHMFWNFVSSSQAKIQAASNTWSEGGGARFRPVVNESNEDSIPLPKAFRPRPE